jgi:ribose 5-phosphate isomerase B
MKLVIGCDEAAFEFKEGIKSYLKSQSIECLDVGVYNTDPVLYPDIAAAACQKILDGEADRGILICGTGIGMSITANKFKGIRAAVCHDIYSTERSRKSNDVQVMCLGARVIGLELAKMLVAAWLDSDFAGGNSTAKVERISHYENCSN